MSCNKNVKNLTASEKTSFRRGGPGRVRQLTWLGKSYQALFGWFFSEPARR